MAKPTTIKIRLNSTMTEKMVKKKYDPVARKHVEFKEGKIK